MTDAKTEIISWIKTILFAVLLALFITNFIIVNATVPTGSMKTNIMENDRIVAFRLSYLLADPERFDIVVFKFPDDETQRFVKRIIGLPGDTVDIINGKVYINGQSEPLDDSFIREPHKPDEDMSFNVPDEHYFVMGDNRNESNDSRSWNNHFVGRKKILGKVVARYFPLNKMRLY